jgi:Na+-driven multidrug efflux pump
MQGDYRVGGMEDYRRLELNPAVNTVGLAQADADGWSDKARMDRLRSDFRANIARGGNRDHAEVKLGALSRSLLSSEKVRANEALWCGMTPEARRQLGFTILLIMVSLNYTFMSTLEQRFVGHIGKDAMAAKSISYTMMGYFSGISCVLSRALVSTVPSTAQQRTHTVNEAQAVTHTTWLCRVLFSHACRMMWAAISTKIGRAVGAKDYASIGKYFKMAARLGIGCGNPTLTA